MSRTCPYCDADALDRAGEEGTRRCRACGRTSLATHPPVEDGSGDPTADADPADVRIRAAAGETVAGLAGRGAPGEVPGVVPAGLGLALTVVFYGVLELLPASPVTELFTGRGWVPVAITAISAWALVLLAARMRRLRREARALDHRLLDPHDGGAIRPGEAAGALARLRGERPEIAESFLARRLARALRHFESRRRVAEVVEYLAAESRVDEQRVDASYSLVRVFVWAVPTLGFIGTVLGIGAAVGSFSQTLEGAASLDALKESIGAVTGGLGIAFDTTLLALVMSILIMFPANAVQRTEESLLAAIDDYCAEHLVRRLEDDPTPATDEGLIDALARRLLDGLREPDAADPSEPTEATVGEDGRGSGTRG